MRTSNITERLARACARRRRVVLGGWALAVLAAAMTIAALLGSALTTDDDFTGRPESQRAEQLLQRAFAAQPGARPAATAQREFQVDEAVIVTSQGRLSARDPRFARRLRTLAADIRATGAGRVKPGPVSRDGRSALLLVELRGDVGPVVDRVTGANGRDGFRTLIVGAGSIDADFSAATAEDLSRGELFGLALALLVLIGVFGSLVAALVPIAVAVASIVVALAAVALVGQAYELNFVVVNVLVMMGLAVGIDYSLFVVSRYREERAAGRDGADAIAVAGATASRAVLFSGATVVLALVGMFLVPHTIFRSIAAGAIIVVVVSVLAALTLLPAALAAFGDRIERLRVPLPGGRRRAGGGRDREGLWPRVVGVALRRPGV
ncbi:MAG: putative drug exporter of the superfamily, partial [Solirubrobacteraceae bacterium]|nr:putative drug exporter of the superfamily [Solirubrobacteraceae bacterium]